MNQDRDLWLERFVSENFSEQRRARRWGILFKTLTFVYLFVVLILFVSSGYVTGPKVGEAHTAMVSVSGVIAADQAANANTIVTGLRRAFEAEHSAAVVMVVNSPGGSPVQSGYVYDEIWRLREKYPDKKLYSVITDLGASGGYYMAVAANEIYADKASLVGSIGVTASSFGFVDAIERLGVERRHFTSGEHKAFLDPFSPLKSEEGEFWAGVLANVHAQFIEVVRRGRGDRLKSLPGADIFSGLIWSGEQALELGLIDGLGSPGFVAREIVGVEEVVDYTVKPSPVEALVKQLGVSVGRGAVSSVGLSSAALQLY
jgi:protease-4